MTVLNTICTPGPDQLCFQSVPVCFSHLPLPARVLNHLSPMEELGMAACVTLELRGLFESWLEELEQEAMN